MKQEPPQYSAKGVKQINPLMNLHLSHVMVKYLSYSDPITTGKNAFSIERPCRNTLNSVGSNKEGKLALRTCVLCVSASGCYSTQIAHADDLPVSWDFAQPVYMRWPSLGRLSKSLKKGVVRTLFDPACGTGGMLAVADEYLHELNPDARLEVFGQDHNPESYAVCGSDMLIKGHDIEHIVFGSSFTKDGFTRERFDYLLANPPFGVEWKPEQDAIKKEHEALGYDGRFGAGLPRINDGSFLFLQHMISKMNPAKDNGSRIGIVFNGSPLFTGDAGSGESEIRRWIIESDWLEAIVALPDQLFYNTGIFTYVWIITNRKPKERRGKVQLINGVQFFRKMRKSLNNKRNEISPASESRACWCCEKWPSQSG